MLELLEDDRQENGRKSSKGNQLKWKKGKFSIDAFFLNEDRHTHNIAIILNGDGMYQPAPVFDHGAALLSDITLDYPMGEDIYLLLDTVKPKTFCSSFEEQLDYMELLYGQQIHFSFTKKDVNELLEREPYYPAECKDRVRDIIFYQMRKYAYLF